jgi:hypothetical protein
MSTRVDSYAPLGPGDWDDMSTMDDYSSKKWGEDFLPYTILRDSTQLVNTCCLVTHNPLFSRQRAPLDPQQSQQQSQQRDDNR